MNKKETKGRELRKKLLHKYRLVVLNEDTFEERISFKLNRLNVFVLGTLSAFFLIAMTTLLIAFTPLREYIPGYSSTALKRQATTLTFKVDSLESQLAANDLLFSRIQKVLAGEIEMEKVNRDSLFNAFKDEAANVELAPSEEDLRLREEVALEDKFSLLESASSRSDFVLFPPVKGSISQAYNPKEKHFAVDLTSAANTPVKSAADGTVIFAEWTAQTGYVCIIEHPFGLISVYKHNASLSKEQGDLVKSGEVIGIIGNTGELTTGPHLHFELWSEGYPVNPEDYIDFE